MIECPKYTYLQPYYVHFVCIHLCLSYLVRPTDIASQSLSCHIDDVLLQVQCQQMSITQERIA